MREMRDTLRAAFARVMPNRRAAVRAGTLERFPFRSEILGNERQITVYLPPGYRERQDLRYPVLYMQDGQNLFDDARAFGGHSWRLHEAADLVIGRRAGRPMIIVGVDHTSTGRIDEYPPTRDETKKAGGKAGDYGRMLVSELKPRIDAHYRTLPDAPDTALGGSSLGGLVSLHLGLIRPDVFGALAVMSPSVWWHERVILRDVDAFDRPLRPRIWLDTGGREGAEALRDVRMLRDRLQARGWSDRDLRYYEDRRGDHSERAWARRAPMVLEFLFGTVSS